MVPGPMSRQQWYIIGRRLRARCFVALLGIGEEILYKDIRLAIDGRRYLLYGGCPMHAMSTPHIHMRHHFFRQLHSLVAEALPKYTAKCVGHSS